MLKSWKIADFAVLNRLFCGTITEKYQILKSPRKFTRFVITGFATNSNYELLFFIHFWWWKFWPLIFLHKKNQFDYRYGPYGNNGETVAQTAAYAYGGYYDYSELTPTPTTYDYSTCSGNYAAYAGDSTAEYNAEYSATTAYNTGEIGTVGGRVVKSTGRWEFIDFDLDLSTSSTGRIDPL